MSSRVPPFLADGWEVSIDSGGSIEIDISAHGKDCITLFDPAENREYPQGTANDGGMLEYVFESDEKSDSKSVTKEQVAEIAADIMTTFYGIQVGALETQEFRTEPVPFWLVSF
jgi:hypothetical protein